MKHNVVKHLPWLIIGFIGACCLGVIALRRGEHVSALWIVVSSVAVYLVAYRYYSLYIAKNVMRLDPARATPAVVNNDGLNYVPTHRNVLFGHHFAAIAGAGPLVGPVLAAQMGYLPGTLWLLAGGVVAGAVQDFIVLFLSTRRNGVSLGEIVKDDIVTSEAWDALSGQVNSNTSGLIETALANNADMQRWRKENGERKAEILEVRTTLVDETRAFAQKLEHVSVKLGENEAAIETKATTVFEQNGDGKAIHSVQAGITHNKQYHSAGMAIGAEVKDGQVKTQVLFEADRLALLNRANGQVTVPFVVQNGQTFINEAFINDGTITNGKIGNYIQSTGYESGAGWRLDKSGSFRLKDDNNTTRVEWGI